MLYIVAGNNNEYRDWVIGQKTIHVSETRYVSNADQLRGMSSIEGLFIGTCFDRPDISQIVNHINVIRSRTAKPIIKMESLFHLTRYNLTNHFSMNATTVPNWSQNNIPVANVGTATSRSAYLTGTTYDNIIFDESTINPYIGFEATTIAPTTRTNRPGYGDIAPSFKVPLSTNTTASESMFILKVAKSYKSYITNSYNAMDNTIEHFFNMKDDAVHFAKVYNAQAYEYN